jgi:hypothetical protein
MPVRNGMPYVAATLGSIAAQTYPHYKILVWDNGSTDGTLELLHQWIPSRIPGRIVEDRPLRLGPTMGTLVEMADTELCAVIHGDDLNLPSRLERQVAFMQSHPHAGAVGGQIDVIDEHGTVQDTGPFWKYETDDASVRWRLRWHAQFCHPGVMLRRTAVLQAGNYRDLQPFEDFDLWQRMANTSELWNVPEKVLQYRRTSTSSTGAIVEYLPLDRQAASLNSGILFPGVPKERVMDLWEATHPYNLESPSKFRHIYEIERAAVNLARTLGKPTDYFLKTALFQRQQDTLKKRFYARVGLLPLSALRQRILHLGHN